MEPFGEAFGGLDAEAVHEELFGEFAVLLELGHEFGDFVADGDGLHGDHVEFGGRRAVGVCGPEEVGGRHAVALLLARRRDEARELGGAVFGVEDDDVVAVGVAGEEADERARVQVGLVLPHALELGPEAFDRRAVGVRRRLRRAWSRRRP